MIGVGYDPNTHTDDWGALLNLIHAKQELLTGPPSGVCAKCTNHPANGGSGVCFCTLNSVEVAYEGYTPSYSGKQ